MIDFRKTVLYYNRIKDNLGVKFIIECSDDVTSDEITDIYSKLSISCIPSLNEGKKYNLSDICLDTLNILPGNLSRYPRIIMLYDDSKVDKIYNIGIEELDNYDGDMMEICDGNLTVYSDSSNNIIIRGFEEKDSDEISYCCMLKNGEFLSLFEDDSNSPYVIFARQFVTDFHNIKMKKEQSNCNRRTRTKKGAN